MSLRFKEYSLLWLAAILTGTFLFLLAEQASSSAEKYLFVWASDPSRKVSDFLAVVNFDDHSSKYGKVIATLSLPEGESTEDGPHPVALSTDGNVLACGGLLNSQSGPKQIFFFDVSNPTHPKLISEANPTLSALPGEICPLDGGGFLVTMMCGTQRRQMGRLVEFDKNLKLVAEYPQVSPPDGFHPHGISIRSDIALMVTSDFGCPFIALGGGRPDSNLTGSLRVWRNDKRRILRTIEFSDAGEMVDVCLIPGDWRHRSYTGGVANDQLYVVDTDDGIGSHTVRISKHPFRVAFDFSTIAKGGGPQLIRMSRDGKRLFVCLNKVGKVVMLDTSDPEKPKLLKVLDLGSDSGPHIIALTKDGKRLIISDYFLNEDAFGKTYAGGDYNVRVAKVLDKNLVLDRNFKLDFINTFPSGPARPNGVAMK